MFTSSPTIKAPVPPMNWGLPAWLEDDGVLVKGERLGESPVWYCWTPDSSGDWTQLAMPRNALRTPPPAEVKLILKEGMVTLTVDERPQPLPFGDIKAAVLHPRKPWVALVGSSPRHPPQPAVWDVDQQRFLTPLEEDTTGPVGESLHWQGTDGFPLQGFFYACDHSTAPLCILVHDGPVKAVRGGWPDKARTLAAAGVHTLYVNYRGSEGLAIPSAAALCGVWGEKDVADLASAKDYLVAAGKVRSTRFAIWGGRAGGFGVLNAVTRYPQAFDVAIAVYPLLDPLATARRKGDAALLATWRAFLGERQSPLLADHLPAPQTQVRVYHGKEDPEVPYADVEAWVHRRRREGWSLALTGYDNMGSRFSHIEQWRHYHQEAVRVIAGDARKTMDRLQP